MSQFVRTKQAITEQNLLRLERDLGFVFPTEFSRHYLIYNGGRPENYHFVKDGEVFICRQFLPMKYGPPNCLFEDVFRSLKIEEQDVMPTYLVPFADDPGGDFFCFSTRPEDEGSVWVYIGDNYEQGEPESAVEKLADSLQAFLDGMVTDEEAQAILDGDS